MNPPEVNSWGIWSSREQWYFYVFYFTLSLQWILSNYTFLYRYNFQAEKPCFYYDNFSHENLDNSFSCCNKNQVWRCFLQISFKTKFSNTLFFIEYFIQILQNNLSTSIQKSLFRVEDNRFCEVLYCVKFTVNIFFPKTKTSTK